MLLPCLFQFLSSWEIPTSLVLDYRTIIIDDALISIMMLQLLLRLRIILTSITIGHWIIRIKIVAILESGWHANAWIIPIFKFLTVKSAVLLSSHQHFILYGVLQIGSVFLLAGLNKSCFGFFGSREIFWLGSLSWIKMGQCCFWIVRGRLSLL